MQGRRDGALRLYASLSRINMQKEQDSSSENAVKAGELANSVVLQLLSLKDIQGKMTAGMLRLLWLTNARLRDPISHQ